MLGLDSGHPVRQGARIEKCCVFVTAMDYTWMGAAPLPCGRVLQKVLNVESICKRYEQMRPRPTGTDYVRALL